MSKKSPIGVFDSGYGGLTILSEIRKKLPEYDFLYLGDNARAPYGNRSYEIVYEYTLEAVKLLFDQGCHLVILLAIQLPQRHYGPFSNKIFHL